MTDRPTLADRFGAIDPADLTTDQVLLYTLIEETIGLRADVVKERRGRRLSNQVIGVAFALAFLVGSLFAIDQLRDEAQTCRNRKEANARIRDAISVAVDQGARELQTPDGQRVEIRARVDAAVLKAYPPPNC